MERARTGPEGSPRRGCRDGSPREAAGGELEVETTSPARLNNPETIDTFTLFAALIGSHLNAVETLAESQATLLSERQASELREQFIAVLGHDLRNPLAAIAAAARMISKAKTLEAASDFADLMQSSVLRMSRLIDNVWTLRAGRLGGGFSLQRHVQPVESMLKQIMAELHPSHSDREIEGTFDIHEPVNCDLQRIGQLFSNLLGNAISHGSPDKPIEVRAGTHGSSFELSVANSGDPIPPAAIEKLFQPFYRAKIKRLLAGLGTRPLYRLRNSQSSRRHT